MSKSARGVDAALGRINELRSRLADPDATAEIAKALEHRVNLVAAKAADLVRIGELNSLLPQVAAMFRRFLDDPAKTDPGCIAKKAAAQVLTSWAPMNQSFCSPARASRNLSRASADPPTAPPKCGSFARWG